MRPGIILISFLTNNITLHIFFLLLDYYRNLVEIGSVVVASHHEVSELVDGEDGGGIIVNQIRAGISDKDGEVLR